MSEEQKGKLSRNLPTAIGNSKDIIQIDKHEAEIQGQNKFAMEVIGRKLSFIERMLPSNEQKIAIKLRGQLIEQQGAASIERSRMNNEFFRQALKASYDTILRKGLEVNQRELAETGIINKAALDSKITKLTEDYFNEMERLEDAIYETKSENIRERKQRMLMQRMDEFEATVTVLMKQYEKINEEGV